MDVKIRGDHERYVTVKASGLLVIVTVGNDAGTSAPCAVALTEYDARVLADALGHAARKVAK